MSGDLQALFAGYGTHLSVTELAEVLGISRATAYRWLNDGHVPAYHRAGTWVILRDEIKAWLIDGRVGPDAGHPEARA